MTWAEPQTLFPHIISGRRWLCFYLLCFHSLAGNAGAQTPGVSGRVSDPQGSVVPGAEVKLFGANRVLIAETRTAEDGTFTLPAAPAGRYELRVSAAHFAAQQRILTLPHAARIEVALQLSALEFQVTVTGRHGVPEETFVEPASVRLRGRDELARRDPGHLPRALAEEPGILAQETSPGQGSPVLRGQGAQTVLYLLDGVRFNNSTFRSGNTQYLGWVPSSAVDSVEVFLGPAGAQYGSDALGGAINVMSVGLPAWTDAGWRWSGESDTWFSSADSGAGSSVRASAAGTKLALTLGGHFARRQELRSGGGEDSHSALVRFLGLSQNQRRSVLGSRLPDSDFAHSSWLARVGARPGRDQFLTFHWLQSEQYGIRRYDRLLGGEGHLRSELGPQRLTFAYGRYQQISAGRLRNLEATVSVNRQTDGQISQTRPAAPLEDEVSRVTALGYSVSTSWAPARHHSLVSGAEFYDEFIIGRRTETASSGPPAATRPRFPNGTRYGSLGLYLSDDWEAIPEKLRVDAGLRFSAFRFRSRSDQNVFAGGMPTVPDATEHFTDLTFNAGMSYAVRAEFLVFARVARGFRAPSVFDLGEQGVTGGGFEVSPDEAVALGAEVGDSAGNEAAGSGAAWRALDAEKLWSLETGLRWKTRRSSGSVALFDSEQFDAIQRRALIVAAPVVGQTIGGETIAAQDAAGRIFTALDTRPVVSRANIGRVRIQGVEAAMRVEWSARWSSAFKAAMQRGRELDTRKFARRIAPDTAFLSVRWHSRGGRLWLEAFSEIAGPQTRLNPAELSDARIGAFRTAAAIGNFFNEQGPLLGLVSGGVLTLTGETLNDVVLRVLGLSGAGAALFTRSESYATLNVRGNASLGSRHQVSFSLTNLTDANYRRHGSGFDAAGAGVTLEYRVRIP